MTAAVRVPTPGEGNGVDAFFERCGMHPDTRFDCLATVSRLFPHARFEDTQPQGYCSYTLCDAELGQVVQFRPTAHRIDPGVSMAAQEVYGDLAPRIEELETLEIPLSRCCRASKMKDNIVASPPADEGIALEDDNGTAGSFQVLFMSMTLGISLAELRATNTRGNRALTSHEVERQRELLVVQFAKFIATGWTHRGRSLDANVQRLCGRVGSSMRWRLEQMRNLLPERFRSEVQRVLDDFESIRALPWVLTHGDIVPANVMVKGHDDWTITGFLDWAEAEYLPFGVGLYGLEEFLGESDGAGHFQYYPETPRLRKSFWSQLKTELQDRGLNWPGQLDPTVRSAHALGVLLWHGIAFDNGKLNRVVDEVRDLEEIQRLDHFFSSISNASQDSYLQYYGQQDHGD